LAGFPQHHTNSQRLRDVFRYGEQHVAWVRRDVQRRPDPKPATITRFPASASSLRRQYEIESKNCASSMPMTSASPTRRVSHRHGDTKTDAAIRRCANDAIIGVARIYRLV
jgi:hypothetical protein